jgi:hypothetical protein
MTSALHAPVEIRVSHTAPSYCFAFPVFVTPLLSSISRYGRLDILLNDDAPAAAARRRSTWMNFGLWDVEHGSTGAFSHACAALARAVADAANVPRRNDDSAKEEEEGEEEDGRHKRVASVAGGRGVSMIDLGCGCGDQLQLWAQEYNVQSVLACTPESKQVPVPHPTP